MLTMIHNRHVHVLVLQSDTMTNGHLIILLQRFRNLSANYIFKCRLTSDKTANSDQNRSFNAESMGVDSWCNFQIPAITQYNHIGNSKVGHAQLHYTSYKLTALFPTDVRDLYSNLFNISRSKGSQL